MLCFLVYGKNTTLAEIIRNKHYFFTKYIKKNPVNFILKNRLTFDEKRNTGLRSNDNFIRAYTRNNICYMFTKSCVLHGRCDEKQNDLSVNPYVPRGVGRIGCTSCSIK